MVTYDDLMRAVGGPQIQDQAIFALSASTRMGRPKQLAELNGRPLLAHVLTVRYNEERTTITRANVKAVMATRDAILAAIEEFKRQGASVVEVGVHHRPRRAGEARGASPRVRSSLP
mgnify:CR=1 FL=1